MRSVFLVLFVSLLFALKSRAADPNCNGISQYNYDVCKKRVDAIKSALGEKTGSSENSGGSQGQSGQKVKCPKNSKDSILEELEKKLNLCKAGAEQVYFESSCLELATKKAAKRIQRECTMSSSSSGTSTSTSN